jgi:hypothetical protein
LPTKEAEAIWASALKWMYPKILNEELHGTRKGPKAQEEKKEERQKETENLIEELQGQYHFKTLKDTEEIWAYDEARGVYTSNGEVIIKARLEHDLGPQLTNHDVEEFLGHIRRGTYFDRSGFNPDIEWLGCSDRMLNLRTGQTAPLSHDFLNTTRIPVKYSDVYATGPTTDFFRLVERQFFDDYSSFQCPKIMKFLYDIVEAEDVEFILDFIAYCLWRDYRYAIWILCVSAMASTGRVCF